MILMKRRRFKISSKRLLVRRLAAVLTFVIGLAAVSFSLREESSFIPFKEDISNQVLTVEIPPFINENSSDGEIYSYVTNYGTAPIPFSELKKRNIYLPNVCGILYVSLKNDGKIMLNMEEQRDTETLKQTLKTVFNERAENGVYEENSFRVVKKVMITAPFSAKYNDVVKLIEAVKESGADPIVLTIDEYPTLKFPN